jgi:hypothetical protein
MPDRLVLELLAPFALKVCAFFLVRKGRCTVEVARGRRGSEAAAQRMEQGFQDGGDVCVLLASVVEILLIYRYASLDTLHHHDLTATIMEVKVWTAFFWRSCGKFGSGASASLALALDILYSGTRWRSGDG